WCESQGSPPRTMNPERWQQIEALYLAAVSRDSPGRAAFLESACGSDAELRQEVESLLRHAPQAQRFLETRAPETETNLSGRQVGPYRILSLAGAGGMGEVYEAIDTRLNRTVAIKFVQAELATEAARRRFQRETLAASALNHPHIVTV